MNGQPLVGYYTGSHLPMVYDTACLGARNSGHCALLAPCPRIGSLTAYALLIIALGCRERGTYLVDVFHLIEHDDIVLALHFDDGKYSQHWSSFSSSFAQPEKSSRPSSPILYAMGYSPKAKTLNFSSVLHVEKRREGRPSRRARCPHSSTLNLLASGYLAGSVCPFHS